MKSAEKYVGMIRALLSVLNTARWRVTRTFFLILWRWTGPPSSLLLTVAPVRFLLGKWGVADPIIFDSNDNDRESHCFFELLLDIAPRIFQGRSSIDQVELKMVAGNDDDANINITLLKFISQVDDIAYEKITSRGYLNLNSKPRNECRIVSNSFNPIDAARLRLHPFRSMCKLRVQDFPHDRSTVCFLPFFNQDVRIKNDLLQFKKKIRQAEATDFLASPVVKQDG